MTFRSRTHEYERRQEARNAEEAQADAEQFAAKVLDLWDEAPRYIDNIVLPDGKSDLEWVRGYLEGARDHCLAIGESRIEGLGQ